MQPRHELRRFSDGHKGNVMSLYQQNKGPFMNLAKALGLFRLHRHLRPNDRGARTTACHRIVGGVTLLLLVTGGGAGAVRAAEPGPNEWPRWRGPAGTGLTADRDVPVKWDASAVRWKTPLKGRGQSSPIVSGDRIFLTSALDDGR